MILYTLISFLHDFTEDLVLLATANREKRSTTIAELELSRAPHTPRALHLRQSAQSSTGCVVDDPYLRMLSKCA